MKVRLDNIQLPLAAFTLEADVTFDQPITGIFGPSGAGKTSLLELIAGLRRPIAGAVRIEENVLFDATTRVNVPPRARGIGYVPQDLALFPHLDVRGNIAYGYRPAVTGDGLFNLGHVTEVMEISHLLGRDVTTLSGGEQQRVAFARSILSTPRLLLLDEPMSSLDSRLKKRMIPFLFRIRDEFGIPLVYVTHDASELSALCDGVFLLERGRFVGRGAPADVLG
ncbi:MAG: molybdate transport system ATP-binding protein [Verrucomicrobiota bacterium]